MATTALALLSGAWLIRLDAPSPPDPRAIGILVWRPDNGPVRAGAANLTVSTAVEISGCRDRVDVRVTVTPTVEFWTERARNLASGAVVGIAIPDSGIEGLRAYLSTDAVEGLNRPSVKIPGATAIEITTEEHRPLGDVTVAAVEIPRWGETNFPVSFQFTADWIMGKTPLGRCYVRLPALVGLPTVLSAAEISGRANAVGSTLKGPQNDVVVTSAGQQAGYDARYELTRGVTSVALHGMALDQEGSLPGPDANLNGTHAWTCSSHVIDKIGFIDSLSPQDEQPDLAIPPDANNGAYSLSSGRLTEVLGKPSCATLAAVEESSLGTRRDLALIAIGALFSLGIERIIAAFHSVPRSPREAPVLTSSARGLARRLRRRP